MTLINLRDSFSSVLSNNTKVIALENTLQQGLQNFKDLLYDYEHLHIESENYKTLYIKQKEKCESNSCSSAETLKKIILAKDNIIQLAASALTRLNETKDFKIIDEVFKILLGETPPIPVHQEAIKSEMVSPPRIKEEAQSSDEELSIEEETVSEIEGTPTGRSSPIIQTKKLRSSIKSDITSADSRDKKKCPDNWPTPDNKTRKLTYSTPLRGKQNSRLRQARLHVVKVPESNIIDITSSPEFSGGSRKGDDDDILLLVKKEQIDIEETILPSPTSVPTSFPIEAGTSQINKTEDPLLRPILDHRESDSESYSESSDQEQNDKNAPPKKKRVLEIWFFMKKFDNFKQAEEELKQENIWSLTYSHHSDDGMKTYYRCNKAKHSGPQCSAKRYILQDALSDTVFLYRSAGEHDHESKMPLKRGLSDEVKKEVSKLMDLRLKPRAIMAALAKMKGIEMPKLSQVKHYIFRRRNITYDGKKYSLGD